jgi:hypothetical protein
MAIKLSQLGGGGKSYFTAADIQANPSFGQSGTTLYNIPEIVSSGVDISSGATITLNGRYLITNAVLVVISNLSNIPHTAISTLVIDGKSIINNDSRSSGGSTANLQYPLNLNGGQSAPFVVENQISFTVQVAGQTNATIALRLLPLE